MDKEFIKHLAELSKLSFTESELSKITLEMEDIITLMDSIKDADKFYEQPSKEAVSYADLRDDIPCKSSEKDDILKNAKRTEKSNFAVPKVV